MAAIVDTQRPSALPSTLDANDGDEKQAIWTTLLDAAASTKALPLKNLIILGGDREQQNQVIDSLAQKPSARARQADIAKTRPPAATNELAIGYTYQNVYDADHEGSYSELWGRMILTRSRSCCKGIDIHALRMLA